LTIWLCTDARAKAVLRRVASKRLDKKPNSGYIIKPNGRLTISQWRNNALESGCMAAAEGKKTIPVRENLWTTPSLPNELPQLIGSKCPSCGEVVFPKNRTCTNCLHPLMEEVKLSRRGKIYNLSTVMLPPPKFKGQIPYAIGFVELPEGLRMLASFSGDPEILEVGMDVVLVLETVYSDENGNEIIGFRYKPIADNIEAVGKSGTPGLNL